MGCRRVSRHHARLCFRKPRHTRCGSGYRRDRFSHAGQGILWHRHVSLVMPAFAMMAVIRYRANDMAPPKNNEDEDHQDLIRWSIQEVRRITNKLAQRRTQPAFIIAWSC